MKSGKKSPSILYYLLLIHYIAVAHTGVHGMALQKNAPTVEKMDELQVQAGEYIIYPDNILKISVYNEPELSLSVRVDAEGYINYPLIGKIQVKGLTIGEVNELISKKLADGYINNPQVNVSIEKYSTVDILGEVAKPGNYPIERNMTVVTLISRAGGFKPSADLNNVKIIRVEDGKKTIIKVRAKEVIERGDKTKDILLKPGDLVIVPERKF
jgi:polysaccharide export outer membrane protein